VVIGIDDAIERRRGGKIKPCCIYRDAVRRRMATSSRPAVYAGCIAA
jgi:hypothetical protein